MCISTGLLHRLVRSCNLSAQPLTLALETAVWRWQKSSYTWVIHNSGHSIWSLHPFHVFIIKSSLYSLLCKSRLLLKSLLWNVFLLFFLMLNKKNTKNTILFRNSLHTSLERNPVLSAQERKITEMLIKQWGEEMFWKNLLILNKVAH